MLAKSIFTAPRVEIEAFETDTLTTPSATFPRSTIY